MNQIPGASFFTSKIELAKASPHLQLLPKSFVVPSQYDEFIAYHQSLPEGTTWVKKGTKHRGVAVVDPYDPALKADGQDNFVQQFVRPHLIDGCGRKRGNIQSYSTDPWDHWPPLGAAIQNSVIKVAF